MPGVRAAALPLARWADARLTDRDRLIYLNRGYVILDTVIEALAGRPYADHVSSDRICAG